MVEEADAPDLLADVMGRKSAATPSSSSRPAKRRSTERSTTPPLASTSASSSRVLPPSPSLAIKFAGKVYRTLDTQLEGIDYSPAANFLGEPDEEVGDVERERADNRRRQVERTMLLESGRKRMGRGGGSTDSDDDLVTRGDSLKRGRTTGSSSKLSTPTKRATRPPRSLSPPPARIVLARQRPSPPNLGLPFSLEPTSPSKSTHLPPALADLVTLHAALEGALIMHLGTAGWAVASSAATDFDEAGRATVRIPNLIDLQELGKMVRSGAQQFGEKELARLVWAWEGCGIGEEGEDAEEEDLKVEMRGEDEAGGLGFIVSKTRIGKGHNIQNIYGIGIAVTLKSNPQLPKLELVAPSSPSRKDDKQAAIAPPSPSSIGKGREGMNVVALWTQGKDARREELVRRLRAWGRRCAREEQAQQSPIYDPNMAAFPVVLPAIPCATLPSLAAAVPSVPGTNSPSPKKKMPSDVFGPAVPIAGAKGSVVMLLEGKVAPSAASIKASERNKLMRERLAAKNAEARRPATNHAFLSTLSDGGSSAKRSLKPDKGINMMYTVEKEMYKRNAMVSRLGNVADVVSMLSLKCGGKPILLYEVSTAVSNSPLVKIGEDEAHQSLVLLCELFPDFAHIKSVDRQAWLYLKRDARPTDVKARVAKELEAVRSASGSYS